MESPHNSQKTTCVCVHSSVTFYLAPWTSSWHSLSRLNNLHNHPVCKPVYSFLHNRIYEYVQEITADPPMSQLRELSLDQDSE